MIRHLGLRLQLLLLFSSLLVIENSTIWAQVQPQARITQAVDSTRSVSLEGNIHPMARAEFDRGAVDSGQAMSRILLLLKRSDAQEAALLTLMEQQQDKSSTNYHAWLTPEDFGSRFGVAGADIQVLIDWLTSQGFVVNKIYGGRTLIEFSGSVAQVQQAFGTQIRKYEVEGNTYLANAQNPQIPVALSPVVAGIVSLNNFPRISHARYRGIARKVAGHNGLQPLFTFPRPSGTGDFYGLGPGDFATIYNSKALIGSGNDGTGQTVAVVGETNIKLQDVTDFRSIFGLPSNFSASNIILNGEDPGITSIDEESEADLDVQWAGATAPGATIKFVVSASTAASSGVDLSALYIVEHNLAGVLSESYGECEQTLGAAGNAFYNYIWQQAAAQGITVVLSSGDGGSAGCDNFNTESTATKGLAVSGLSGTPYNISVGGTDFDQRANPLLYWNPSTGNSPTGTSAKSYIPEIPWNESCAQISLTGCGASAPDGSLNIVAGSGGQSTVYHKPFWQTGVTGVPASDHRYQPDVSLFASPGFNNTGYIVCQQDRNTTGLPACDLNTNFGYLDFHIFGGTSASAPAFAGVIALVNQYQAAHGGSNRQGNANIILYALAKKSGASCTSSASEGLNCIFNDIAKGSSDLPTGGVGLGTNSVPCTGGKPNCSIATAGTGVLVDPAHTGTEAWTTTAGYDLATGLGTVNIGNLATNWKNVSTVATTTTLTLSPVTGITHGANENVTVNVTVKPTTGTASGDIALIAKFADGTTQALDQFTLSNGAITGLKTQSLPGGSYGVIAHYAGDGTNAPSDSTPVAVTVAKENSQVFILIPTFDFSGASTSANASSVAYGSQFFIRMYAANTSATLDANGFPTPFCLDVDILTCPTGTIVLTDNGTAVDQGTFTLNNSGYTRNLSPSPSIFTGGTHKLKAVYSGDGSFVASIGNNTITVTPVATQSQLTYNPVSATAGESFQLQAMLTASVISGAAMPTGTLKFYDGANILPGTVNQLGNPGTLYANVSTSIASPGTHSISVKYDGDSNFAGSTSSPITIAILNPVTITQSESSTSINYGQSINLTAIVSSKSKSPAMTGQVQFYGNFPTINQLSVTPGTDANGNQILTATATVTPSATTNISVSYSGDSNYGPMSTSGDLINVNIPDFSIPANVTINAIAGQTGSATIQVTPASNIPSTVGLMLYTGAPPGTNLIISPTTVNLNGTPQTVTFTLATTGTNGVQSTVRTQVKRAGLLAISRNDWWSTSIVFGILTLFLMSMPRRRRYLKVAFLSLAIGTISLAIGCGGGGGGTSGGGGGGGGGGTTQVVSSTMLTVDNPKIGPGMSAKLTAAVTSSIAPTGTVTFYRDGVPVSQTIALVSGKASFDVPYFSVGTWPFTAQYSGDSKNKPSTSTALSQVYTGSAQVYVLGTTSAISHQTAVTINLQ